MLGTIRKTKKFFFFYSIISGMIIQGGWQRFAFIRIFGVLQRLALCYFFAAIIVLIFDDKDDEPYTAQWATGIEFSLRN